MSGKLVIPHRALGLLSRNLLAAVAATCVVAGAARAQETQAYPLVCAERDLRVVTLIELHGQAQIVPADTLAQAYFEVIKARDACTFGRVAEGVAIYDRLLPGLEEIEGEVHAAR